MLELLHKLQVGYERCIEFFNIHLNGLTEHFKEARYELTTEHYEADLAEIRCFR